MLRRKNKSIDEKQVKEWIERAISKLEDMDLAGKKSKNKMGAACSGGVFWFIGFLGALVYFWQYVTTATTAAIAIIKAVVWPGFLVYHVMKFLRI